MKKIIICVVFMLFSCVNPSEFSVQVKFDKKTFVEQRQLWQDANIKNYQYQLSAIGFIYYYGTIFVENGRIKNDVASVENSNIENFMNYSTIDDIYKAIEEMFNSSKNQSKNDVYCTAINVKYDKMKHIPIDIVYSYYASSDIALDGTFHYKITEFNERD